MRDLRPYYMPLDELQDITFDMPAESKVIHVSFEKTPRHNFVLWVEQDSDAKPEKRRFIRMTEDGGTLTDDAVHVGSATMRKEHIDYTHHIYEVSPE